MIALFAALLAQTQPAVDPAVFAPGVRQLEATLSETRARVARSDAIGRALARIHNRWGERLAVGTPSCTDVEARTLTARTVPFGAAYRDEVQSARATSARLARLLEAPSLTPLIGAADQREAQALLRSIREHARIYTELSGWQAVYVEPYLRRCAPTLEPAPGLAGGLPSPTGEVATQVAVIALGSGVLCPGEQGAGGRVVVLTDDRACYGVEGCSCTPELVRPGAVLGP